MIHGLVFVFVDPVYTKAFYQDDAQTSVFDRAHLLGVTKIEVRGLV